MRSTQHQPLDISMTLSSNPDQPKGILMPFDGYMCRRHQHRPRLRQGHGPRHDPQWQHRALPSACSSPPSSLQFLLSPQHVNLCFSFSSVLLARMCSLLRSSSSMLSRDGGLLKTVFQEGPQSPSRCGLPLPVDQTLTCCSGLKGKSSNCFFSDRHPNFRDW